ncbi:MAG: SsrA-binding protein SmpB [Alphaproteobacteria bacterium]|nr:SsrA-binding protein SmpB [Alphaproteobacteria bacterium]
MARTVKTDNQHTRTKKNIKTDRATNDVKAYNRRARFEYEIGETIEAGIALTGTEVRAIRDSSVSLKEAYASDHNNEIMLYNMYIPPCAHAHKKLQHETRRMRRLLLHRREINKLIGAVKREGIAIVPLKLFFNKRGIAKIELGISEGRKKADKRAAIKNREWKVEQGRLLKKNYQ